MMNSEEKIVFSRIKAHVASGGDLYEAVSIYYDYLHTHIPMDRMSLSLFCVDKKSIRIIAQASNTGGEKTDFLLSAPEGFLESFKVENPPETFIINEPENDPIGKDIISRSGFTEWALIGVPIRKKNVARGAIFFTVAARNSYSQKHAALLSALTDAHEWLLDTLTKDHREKTGGMDQKERVENKYEFFRQATRRLCGHLDMETSVLHCLQYLSRFFHGSMLSVHKHHREDDTDIIGVGPTPFFNYFDPDMMARETEILSPMGNRPWPKAVITNRPECDPTLNRTVKTYGSDWSAITLYLSHKKTPLGLASLITRGRNAFSKENMDLFSMLHDPFSLALSNHIKHREVIRLKNIIEDEKKNLQEELNVSRGTIIVGEASGLKDVMASARIVADRESPVLLSGETGVGKELIADFIHRHSSRRDGPLIKVNCGAIPDNLVDSELFGHEKGAFTGADTQKKGRFERADGGTIFLDEIAELPLPAQVRMLRVLQNKVIDRVGGTDPVPVDIRVIAATHENLEKMVASGAFRKDLWFRLNVFPIHIPPLRSRQSDIPALVHHFIDMKSREMNLHVEPFLTSDAMTRLLTYEWPGNVRELGNVIERELILNKGEALAFQNIIPGPPNSASQNDAPREGEILEMDKAFARHILNVLTLTEGKINGPGGAAALLKTNPSTLRHRMDKLGIPYGWKRRRR